MAPFFRNRMTSTRRREAALDLTSRARDILSIDDDTIVSVSEHDCGDPSRSAKAVIPTNLSSFSCVAVLIPQARRVLGADGQAAHRARPADMA